MGDLYCSFYGKFNLQKENINKSTRNNTLDKGYKLIY